jgi:thiol:disulfide interchange protein
LGLLFSLDITIVRDTSKVLLAAVLYGLVIAVSAGTLMLALSSLSRNSRYVAMFWLGVWILSSTVSAVLMSVEQERRTSESGGNWQAWANEEHLQRKSRRRSPIGGRLFHTPPT